MNENMTYSQVVGQGDKSFHVSACVTGFGQQQQQQSGTRQTPWRKTSSGETSNGKSDGSYFFSISAMPEYSGKSFEELRWEDYQVGVMRQLLKAQTQSPPELSCSHLLPCENLVAYVA